MLATPIVPALVQSDAGSLHLLRTMVDALPSDRASIFTILLVAVSLGATLWFGGRPGGKGGRTA